MPDTTKKGTAAVLLPTADYIRVMGLFGGLGPSGRGAHSEVILIPHAILTQAGWEVHPSTVRDLQNRIDRGSEVGGTVRTVRILLDPNDSLLANPVPIPKNVEWKEEAYALVRNNPITLANLIEHDALLDDVAETSTEEELDKEMQQALERDND